MRQKHSEFRRHTTHTQYILPLQIVRQVYYSIQDKSITKEDMT